MTTTDRVFLHVGVPKTGTTFVQDVLWRGRAQLARAGVCYPLRRRGEHFAATMDVRRASWGGRRDPAWEGTWERLADTVRRSTAESGTSTAVLSSELLAAADLDAVARAVGSFPDHEVHVVLTVRDLARQLVSGWQEQVKHRVVVPLADFVGDCLDDRGPLAERFWLLHDLPEVARRWASGVPAQRLHLVTVPPPGGPHGELWRRFAGVCGIDESIGLVDTARPNTSLTASEAELLRRVNARIDTDPDRPVPPRHYDQVVRVLLAEKVLAGAADHDRAADLLVLPARFTDAVHARAAATAAELAARGHDVVGDLTELVPDRDALATAAGDRRPVRDDEVAATAVRAAAGLVLELGPLERRLRSRGHPLVDEVAPVPWQPPAGRTPAADERPVYLHVGAPKTGTTFLQDVMWHHREALAEAGVLFTRRRYDDHFRASLDLRQQSDRPGAAGVWAQVARDSAGWPGTSVISHEFFAAARPEQVARALRSLGADRVHVVYTARDLWGLLGAEWQEVTKHGRELTFDEFLDDVLDQGAEATIGSWFWSVHDPVDVLRRWGGSLPPERVHLVTVPPAGTDPGLLWERFAALVGIDPQAVDTAVARPNASLGAAEVGFLRRVNARLGAHKQELFRRGEYARFVKDMLAQEVLAARTHKSRYAPPGERFAQVRERAEQFVSGLRTAGYAVHGDLAELVPAGPPDPARHPDDTPVEELADVGVDAISGMVWQVAGLREAHGIGGLPPGRTGAVPGPRSLARRLVHRITAKGGRR